MSIPFVRDLEVEYGTATELTPMIRRVIANNPSAFTFHGTGTYIVGHGEVAVIDPGPLDDAHIAALLQALDGETVTHILITHTHNDHSPAAAPLKAETGAPTYGFGPHGGDRRGLKVEEGGDWNFKPDHVIGDGTVIEGPGWSFEAVHTPGHTSNHICFALRGENILFTGDHVMGWSTSVIAPPDGNMADYLASLKKLLDRDDKVYWPTHGPAITKPQPFVRAFLVHRSMREQQIKRCIGDGATTIEDLVKVIYASVDPRLHLAASRTVLAHLINMVGDGRVACEGEPDIDAVYSAAG